MKKYIFLIATITISVFLKGYGQEKLSKHEIAFWWKKSLSPEQNSLKEINFLALDDSVKNKLKFLQTNYDTVGFFFISENGIISLDHCREGNMPSDIYVFWKNLGKTYVQKMTNHCIEREKEIKEISFFDFFEENINEIEKEYLMPVILGARKEGEKIFYNQITTSHESSYFLFCRIGIFSKTLLFSEGDISNQQGLFYSDNLNSKSYQWFLHAKHDIMKL